MNDITGNIVRYDTKYVMKVENQFTELWGEYYWRVVDS